MTQTQTGLTLIDTDAAAAMLGLPSSTLTYWRAVETGPPFLRIGRRIKYEPGDVVEWARSMRSAPVSQSNTIGASAALRGDGIY